MIEDETPSVSGKGTGLDIAIVDDDRVSLKLMGSLLAKRNHRTRLFTSPRLALDELVREPAHVVVCDLKMPSMNGDELCLALREQLGGRAPPFIIVSSAEDEDEVGNALDSGAAHFIQKPFSQGQLIAIVERAGRKCHEAARPPTQLGRYALLGELGRGGMGIVFRARRDDGKQVALKLLTANADAIEEQLRFRRELDVLAGLEHPHIAKFIESGTEGGRTFYVMELVTGLSLANRITVQGALPLDFVARVGRDIASALAYVHERGIVHRDVKPSNIVLGVDGSPRLVDFGLARRPHDNAITATKDLVGTPLYMGPETLQGSMTPAGDVYALGMTLFEAVSGRHPLDHAGLAALAVLDRIRAGALPRLVDRANVPLAFAALIHAAVATVPDRRPRAVDFARALSEFTGAS